MRDGTTGLVWTRRRWLIALMGAGLMLLAAPVASQGQPMASPLPVAKIPVVVLDPGRGGSNLGAQGPTGLVEKDITLQLATEAGRLIEELLGVRVVLTRTDDSDVPLDARAALANKSDGDLFISICAGGSLAMTRREFQILYFDDLQERLPQRSPPARASTLVRVDAGEEGPRHRAATPPQAIQWDQAQREFLDTSQMFGRMLYQNMRTQVAEEGRGVHGLPILLLSWVRMPAVLLDVGSLSDPDFHAKLRDDAYLQRAALGIAQSVNDYQALRR